MSLFSKKMTEEQKAEDELRLAKMGEFFETTQPERMTPPNSLVSPFLADPSRLPQYTLYAGYKQDLKRSLGTIHSFGVSFSHISIIIGLSTLIGYSLVAGGPAGWYSRDPVVIDWDSDSNGVRDLAKSDPGSLASIPR